MLGIVDTCALLLRPVGVRAVHPWVRGLWASRISTRPVNQELVARVNVMGVLASDRSHVQPVSPSYYFPISNQHLAPFSFRSP
jgi:hypothetical protein